MDHPRWRKRVPLQQPVEDVPVKTPLAVAAIQHVTPATTEKINAVLGYTPGTSWTDELVWGTKLNGAKVATALVLFPRPAPPEKK